MHGSRLALVDTSGGSLPNRMMVKASPSQSTRGRGGSCKQQHFHGLLVSSHPFGFMSGSRLALVVTSGGSPPNRMMVLLNQLEAGADLANSNIFMDYMFQAIHLAS